MLYLHEVIDIIGDGQQAYLDSIGKERAPHSERLGISRLVGTWKVVGSTSRWPCVVNLWEMDGWDALADSLERQHLPGRTDTNLAPWWSQATRWRSGGVDRILEPTAYSPTRGDLQARKLVAWVCVHVTVETRPGKRATYLDAVGTTLRPILEGCGLVLMGAYSVPMRSEEAIVLWAAPDFRSLCGLYATRRQNPALATWEPRVRALRRRVETMWLVPSADCFFHPLNDAKSPPG